MSRTAVFSSRPGIFLRKHGLWLLAALLLILLLAPAAYVASMIPASPSIAHIEAVKAQQPTVVMSADGKELAVFRRTNREWVKLSQVSPIVVAALLATEDHRFYEHRGIDIRRTLSAALHTARGDLQGGSTITQQLARNLFPEEIGRAPTIERKVKEAITAFRIESRYSKDEILEMYLNTVPFLYNAYGIEMAARTYFDRSAGELDAIQAATLIGMLKGTTYYNPVLNPERAVQRRNTVLAQLVRHGKLEQAQFDALKKKPLGLNFEKQEEDLGPAPHFVQQLRRWLISWADSHGYNIYADGLVVRTTIDSRLQQMAVEAVTRQADKLQATADKAFAKPTRNRKLLEALVRDTPRFQAEVEGGQAPAQALAKLLSDKEFVQTLWREKTHLQAAFMAQEPASGRIVAWVGSRDFREDQYDHVQQARRQPGSTFKPFVYGAAFAQGIGPAEFFIDQPVEIHLDDNTVWKPGDVHETSGMPTTLRDGLVYSKNSITAQLVQRVGAARVAEVAQAMGVRQSKLEAVPSLALGTSPVTLKEMVSAYGTIANSGRYVEPVVVTRVENRKHEVLEEFRPPAPEEALPREATDTLLDVMRGVVDQGTGAGIRSRFGLKGDFAGKTGTTQDNTDGWFILMHPQLIAGAWVGFNDPRITMGDSWGQGAHNALLIVGDFFQQAVKAKTIDTKAKFAARRGQGVPDPAAIERMNEWWRNVSQWSQDPQAAAQAALGGQQAPMTAPAVIAAPPMEAPTRAPDFQWTPQRPRPAEESPAMYPAPVERAPRMVIRAPVDSGEAPPAAPRELGGPPAPAPAVQEGYPPPPPPPPPQGGVRILRAY